MNKSFKQLLKKSIICEEILLYIELQLDHYSKILNSRILKNEEICPICKSKLTHNDVINKIKLLRIKQKELREILYQK